MINITMEYGHNRNTQIIKSQSPTLQSVLPIPETTLKSGCTLAYSDSIITRSRRRYTFKDERGIHLLITFL